MTVVCLGATHPLCVCVCKSPRAAIHLDSVCSHITSLSHPSLIWTSDGRSPERERENDRSHSAHWGEKSCDTLYAQQEEASVCVCVSVSVCV